MHNTTAKHCNDFHSIAKIWIVTEISAYKWKICVLCMFECVTWWFTGFSEAQLQTIKFDGRICVINSSNLGDLNFFKVLSPFSNCCIHYLWLFVFPNKNFLIFWFFLFKKRNSFVTTLSFKKENFLYFPAWMPVIFLASILGCLLGTMVYVFIWILLLSFFFFLLPQS